jgi:hypothetical protein
MRFFQLLLLLSLVAAHAPFQHHRFMPRVFQSPRSDGMSRSDFGRAFHPYDIGRRGDRVGRYDLQGLSREPVRLNQFEVGNGARVGVGFVQGRRLGLRFGLHF